ncbi:MAG: class I mannose-6-phosphate isomerase [Bacteroidales bacterium]|jgi:mannose-6-phosphate isomerase|nr:class I mannose-6-phosphate isomerase [Bacteroidales bacterium]MCI1733241.1 class I mannose-6-phosphate isomerase [Bacteroidales bacterium]
MRPISFFSIYKPAIWGNESWEISAVKGNESILYVESPQERERRLFADSDSANSNNVTEGTSLTQLIKKYKGALVGEKVWKKYGSRFPLLVKFINAKDDLSVQVHPSDEIAKKKGSSNGKTELWYVIDSVGDAYIFDGFNEAMTPARLRALVTGDMNSHDPIGRDREWTALGGTMKGVAAEDGDVFGFEINSVLNRHTTKRGDWFFIPAGRVHSIGAGTYLVEIQQTSDLTYRLFDFNRVDKDGNHRRLDIDEALESVDYSPIPFNADCGNVIEDNLKRGGKTEVEKLVGCKYFTTSMMHLKHGEAEKGETLKYTFDFSALDSFVILICTDGAGKIFFKDVDANGPEKTEEQSITIKKSDVYLLPASLKSVVIEYSNDVRILETHID